MFSKTSHCKWLKTRPESGVDWLMCFKFDRQRPGPKLYSQAVAERLAAERGGDVGLIIALSHTNTYRLSHTHSSLSLSRTHTLSLSQTHTISHTHTLSPTHTHTHTLSLTHPQTHKHTHTQTLSHTPPPAEECKALRQAHFGVRLVHSRTDVSRETSRRIRVKLTRILSGQVDTTTFVSS